ncbi:lupeol synthase-like [Hevea brasiliensis]|uniref:lupeol synthase-like n=1 Tax=Hevea brasiliensis TaxID=3981 RepID=UPI0025FD84A1|nr:lupeol synthase-like [Hevea brasiliensis]
MEDGLHIFDQGDDEDVEGVGMSETAMNEGMQGRNFVEYVQRNSVDESPRPGSWTFSDKDHGWQVSDSIAESMKCCLLFSMMPSQFVGEKMEPENLYDSVNVLLSLQSKNGGLSAWEPAGARLWLEALVLLKKLYPENRKKESETFIINAVQFLEHIQKPDGSGYG